VRTIALDEESIAYLREHKKRQAGERAQWGSAWKLTGRIFTQEGGSWFHPARFPTCSSAWWPPPD
jgi:hypothetical protein